MNDRSKSTVSFKHPADNVLELEYERHIALEFRKQNLDGKSLGEKTKSAEPTELVSDFSKYVLEQTEKPGLKAENLTYEYFNIDQKFVDILVLREAHNIAFTRLGDCLENNQDVAQKIGYGSRKGVHSGNRINQMALKLEEQPVPGSQDDTFRDLLKNVATRIVWGAVRDGITLPERTIEKYDIKLSREDAIKQVTRNTERAGLHNTVRYLLDQTNSPLEFHRNPNASKEYEQYIATFAAAAHGKDGLSQGWKNLPSSTNLDAPTNILRSIRKDPDTDDKFKNNSSRTIYEQFDEVNLNILELVTDLGIINDGISVAQDPTLVKSELEQSPFTIGSGDPEVWYFPITAGTEPDFRLVLNIDLFDSKNKTHDRFNDRLTKIDKTVGVKHLHLDGEYDSEPVVKACKEKVSGNWLIAGGHNPERDGYPSEDELPDPGDPPQWYEVTVGDTKTNLVALYSYGEKPQLKMFLTNIQSGEMSRAEIIESFNRRQSIEKTIEEVKKFMPKLEADDRITRYYVMGMATYLYNIYTLTKMVYTPKYQLALNPNKKQVLFAVMEVCGGNYPKFDDGF